MKLFKPSFHKTACVILGLFPVLFLLNIFSWVLFGIPLFSQEISIGRALVGIVFSAIMAGCLVMYLIWYYSEGGREWLAEQKEGQNK